MRKFQIWPVAALWALLATAMPLAALEPVDGAAAEAGTPSHGMAVSGCDDGAPRPLVGCVTVTL